MAWQAQHGPLELSSYHSRGVPHQLALAGGIQQGVVGGVEQRSAQHSTDGQHEQQQRHHQGQAGAAGREAQRRRERPRQLQQAGGAVLCQRIVQELLERTGKVETGVSALSRDSSQQLTSTVAAWPRTKRKVARVSAATWLSSCGFPGGMGCLRARLG